MTAQTLPASPFFGLAGGVAGTIVCAAIGSVLEGRVGEGAVIFGIVGFAFGAGIGAAFGASLR